VGSYGYFKVRNADYLSPSGDYILNSPSRKLYVSLGFDLTLQE